MTLCIAQLRAAILMNQIKRKQFILEKLDSLGEVSVIGLSEELGVTSETIRRDLSYLEKSGEVTKVHGGAIKVQNIQEGSFAQRMDLNRQEKILIGQYAASLVTENDTLFIDSCTTTLIFASFLPLVKFTVFTNSSLIADQIKSKNNMAVVHVLGGEYNHTYKANLGIQTIEQMNDIHTDFTFVGVGGIDSDFGVMVKNLDEGRIAKKMLAMGRQKVILCDTSKFGQSGLMKISDINDIDIIVTDKKKNIHKQAIEAIYSDKIIYTN